MQFQMLLLRFLKHFVESCYKWYSFEDRKLPLFFKLLFAFVIKDFIHWNVHRLLHRVSFFGSFISSSLCAGDGLCSALAIPLDRNSNIQ